MITVFKVGSIVAIKAVGVTGYVTAVTLRGSISYEVSYFINDQYYSHWFCDFEIDETGDKITIGYR